MKRHTKIATILIAILIYGSFIALLKGQLPNQDANIVTIKGEQTLSLVPNENSTSVNLSLGNEKWQVTQGENVLKSNVDGNLIFSGSYDATNEALHSNQTEPFFSAQQTGLELDFSANHHYLHVILSSQPDSQIGFLVGRNNSERNLTAGLRGRYPDGITETDDANELMWINVSNPHGGGKLDNNTSYVTIDVADRLAKLGFGELGLSGQVFVGLQIRQYLIGSPPLYKNYSTTIESIGLIEDPPYYAENSGGNSIALPDGSIAHIIGNVTPPNNATLWPFLQRAYVLYKMDAPQDSLYTAFLVYKKDATHLEYGRSGFVFTHTSLLNEVGTYIDWRRISIELDSDFEPLGTLNSVMNEADYAIIFTPVRNDRVHSEVHSVNITSVALTFSELLYIYPNDLDPLPDYAVIIFAFVVPTVLMFALCYLYKNRTVSNSKRTITYLVLIGLGLRLILAPISAHLDDTQIFSEIGALYFQKGSGVLGAQWVSLPGFVYLETAAYFPYALLRTIGFREAPFLSLDVYPVELLFTKIPAILSDIGSFYFILKIADRCQQRNKALIAGLYLLNPLTVYISGTLGQFDSIFTFTLIAFTYYLVADYNAIKASLFSGFSAVLNPVGLATIIPFLSAVSLKKDWKAVAKGLLLIGGIFGISIAPFFFESNSPVILTSLERLIGSVPGERFYSNKIDFLAYGTQVSSSIGYGLTFRFSIEVAVGLGWLSDVDWLGPWYYPFTAGLILLAFVAAFIYKTREACKKGIQRCVHVGTFMLGVVCLFQLTFPLVFEQFVVWVAGLMLVSYILYQNRKFFAIFLSTCIAAGIFYTLNSLSRIGLLYDFLTYILRIFEVNYPIDPRDLMNWLYAILGVIYSVVVAVTFAIMCEVWFKEELARLAQRIRFRLKKHERAQSV
ncbi:PIG-U family protein [Candidatus Bathyarchaeota archaeon]|nr:PIG-U family protein [Candidatus Bathyarchaeota archaeon]